MFSGIIEDMGCVVRLDECVALPLWDGSTGLGTLLTVASSVAVDEAYVGCSIAVNGVCLTATSIDKAAGAFTVSLAPETLRRSNLGLLSRGDAVNVERALRIDGRNSGHMVQGHVDCTGEVLAKWREGDSLWVKIGLADDVMRYVVSKGFVAVDGTSLTVCDVDYSAGACFFTVMLVSHTQTAVVLPLRGVGDRVNIEVDVLAKMVERQLGGLAQRVADLEKRMMADEGGGGGGGRIR